MRTELIRKFLATLKEGAVLGPFSKTSDPGFIEILGHAGFDFVILDMEHGPNSVETVQQLIRAAELVGMVPIVRVKENVPSLIGEVLDVGAGGVQVPQVCDACQAEDVLERARFHPQGMRGVCRFVRAADYSAKDRFEYFKQANEAVIIVQLEGAEALANLEAILAVAGINIVFIGPYDLSQSLGVPGQIDHPIVEEKMKEIVAACSARGMTVGTFVDTIAAAQKWRSLGVRYISYSVDVGIFCEAARSIVEQLGGNNQ